MRHWTLDTACSHWTVDTGHWTLDMREWTLDTGYWSFFGVQCRYILACLHMSTGNRWINEKEQLIRALTILILICTVYTQTPWLPPAQITTKKHALMLSVPGVTLLSARCYFLMLCVTFKAPGCFLSVPEVLLPHVMCYF